jgi:hypothetical protein
MYIIVDMKEIDRQARLPEGDPLLIGEKMITEEHSEFWQLRGFETEQYPLWPTITGRSAIWLPWGEHWLLVSLPAAIMLTCWKIVLAAQLQPWHANLKKRQIKASKLYLRDCGRGFPDIPP